MATKPKATLKVIPALGAALGMAKPNATVKLTFAKPAADLTLNKPAADIKVVRLPGACLQSATGFSPLDIAGCLLWLNASQITSIDDGVVVTTWQDISGNNNHATQATGLKKPLYKTNQINGRPVVRFDATDDGMVTPLVIVLPFTLFLVYKVSPGADARRALQGSVNWFIGIYDSSNQAQYPGAFSVLYGSATINPITGPTIFLDVIRQLNSATDFYENGVSTGSDLAATAPGTLYLGAATGDPPFFEPLDGDIAEVIVYNTALSDADRIAVQNYLNLRYAIY